MKKPVNTMPHRVQDRRLLANVPDVNGGRLRPDRRGYRYVVNDPVYSPDYIEKVSAMSFRYFTNYKVKITCMNDEGRVAVLYAHSCDISTTGIRVEFDGDDRSAIARSKSFQFRFKITPGTLPEGYESNVKTLATLVRVIPPSKTHGLQCAFTFDEPLARYNVRRKDRMSGWACVVFLCLFTLTAASLCTNTLRHEYVWPIYTYCTLAGIYSLLIYLFAQFSKPVLVDKDFSPGVTIIIPCHNERKYVTDSILSCVNQEYPCDKLEVLIIDDASTDDSSEVISEVLERIHQEGERFQTRTRVKYFCNDKYKGRGGTLVAGMARAKHELVLFTDCRGILDPFAVRNIVQPFQDSLVAGTTGRVEIANTYTNSITRMQSIRRSMEDRVLRSAQSVFDTVGKLSATLGCFRKELLLGKISGIDCADGRRLARVLLEHNRVVYQDTALCTWVSPNTFSEYAAEELKEKRSLVRGLSLVPRMWKKEPAIGALYTLGAIIFVGLVPIIFYSIYLAIIGMFPWILPILLLGIFWLLAAVQGISRQSFVWFSGMAHFVFYEILLFWQYPLAWISWWHKGRETL